MSKLKTLKDIEGNIGNAEYFHRKGQEPTKDYEEVIIVKELKAEAIKLKANWITENMTAREFIDWWFFNKVVKEEELLKNPKKPTRLGRSYGYLKAKKSLNRIKGRI